MDSASLSAIARREIRRIHEYYGTLEYTSFREMLRRRIEAPRLQALFERAADDPRPTAWVCNNDTVAVEALRFCRMRKVAVPQQVALLGFDDSLEAFVEGLSSYSFNPLGLMEAMLRSLLNYSHRGKLARCNPISIEGYVNERQTT